MLYQTYILVCLCNRTPSAIPNGTTSLPNWSSVHGCGSELHGVSNETKDGLSANKPTTISVQQAVMEPPAAILALSFASMVRGQEKSTSNSNASSTPATSATVSGVYSSASDPLLAPTVSGHAADVGTIKLEIGPQWEPAETNHIQEEKHVPLESEVSKTEETASEVPNSTHGKRAPSKSKVSETVVSSEVPVVTVTADSQLIVDSKVPNGQHVTFPSDFQVSEALKNGLTFGSFEASFGQGTNHDNVNSVEINSGGLVETSQGSDETGEPFSRLVDFSFYIYCNLYFVWCIVFVRKYLMMPKSFYSSLKLVFRCWWCVSPNLFFSWLKQLREPWDD